MQKSIQHAFLLRSYGTKQSSGYFLLYQYFVPLGQSLLWQNIGREQIRIIKNPFRDVIIFPRTPVIEYI